MCAVHVVPEIQAHGGILVNGLTDQSCCVVDMARQGGLDEDVITTSWQQENHKLDQTIP